MSSLLDIIDGIQSLKQGIQVYQIVSAIQNAEAQVFNASGGIRNKKLRHLFSQSLTNTISFTDFQIVLPEGAGEVLEGGLTVDGNPAAVLTEDQKGAITSNPLYRNAAIRSGNTLTFYNVPKGRTIEVTVVYERPIKPAVYIDDLGVSIPTDKKYGASGQSLDVLKIERPSYAQPVDKDYAGGFIRVIQNRNHAKEYTINTNYSNSDGYFIVVNQNPRTVGVMFPNFKVETPQVYPAILTQFQTPIALRAAIFDYCKYHFTENPMYLKDFERNVKAMM